MNKKENLSKFEGQRTMDLVKLNNVNEYIESFIKPENPELKAIENSDTIPRAQRNFIQSDAASLICLLIKLSKARSMLEIGTCIGYSSIYFAEALTENKGKLITVEHSEKYYEEAVKNIESSKFGNLITPINTDICEIIKSFDDESFDIVFQDSKKALYPELLEDTIRITKKGGLIIADDTLFKPLLAPKRFGKVTHEYNEKVFENKGLYSTIMNLGYGLTVSIKK